MSTIPQTDLRRHDMNMMRTIKGCGRRKHVWYYGEVPDSVGGLVMVRAYRCAKCGKVKSRSGWGCS